jgi:glycosyl transferase family 25
VSTAAAALPPFWVISLQRAKRRRAFVHSTCASLGIEPVVIDAVDGRALTAEQLAAYSELRAAYSYGRSLRRAEIAIALSHLTVWQRMVDEHVDEVLVLEDDVRPERALLDVLAVRAELPEDADVVTMHSLFGWSAPRPVSPELVPGYRLCTYERTPMGTQAYLLRLRAAQRLVDVARPIRLPADELVFRPHPAGLRVYGIEPSPVRHDEFPSELHGTPAARDERRWYERLAFTPVRIAGRIDHRMRSRTWQHPR